MNGIRPFGQTDEDVKVSGIKTQLNTASGEQMASAVVVE